MEFFLLRLVKINSNYYSFMSGVFVALSINLYTNIFSGEQIPTRWKIILASSVLTFVSSVCWIFMAWKFDPMQKLVMSESPKAIHPDRTYKALLAGKEFLFASYFFVAILSAIVGLAVLALGY
jgi:putative effector of murein hydrolase